MAIFIGDKPAQMLQQTGQTIQNIQKEYETEKLRREEYVDQYDAAESDFATVKAEFKPILSKYVDDILKAQTSVEETNSPEAREQLRNLSRDYQRVKAISEAQSQAITKGLADARSGNYYQTEDEVAGQVKESLADLAGMTGEQLLNSKYADPNFIMFQATPYDKAVDMIDVTKYSDRAAKIVGNQVGRIYDSSGRIKVDEARASLGEQADLLYRSSPQALKAAAYMYADQNHPDGINAVQAILEDPEMMAEAKEMYKQAYIESALPMITDKIAVDKGRGEGKIDSYIVRAGGFTLPMESENAGERVAGGYIKVGDKGFLSMSGRAFMGVGAGQGLEEVDINTFIQSLDDKELSRLRNTIDLSSVEGVEGLEVDEEGRIQTPPEKFLEAPITQDIAGEMSRELFYKSLGLEVGEVPNDDPVKKAQVEDYEARRQQAQRGKGGLQEPKKQNPVYPK
jgi:hypothetical protein